MSETVITAGITGADFCGRDNRAIQAAIDAVAHRGGGTVKILPGTYVLEDSVHLRDNVTLIGSGAETILRKGPQVYSRLSADLGYGHYDVSLAEPDKFHVGMAVTIRDDGAFGFYETIATLTWQDGDRFGVDQMLNHDYARSRGGEVYSSSAPISAKFVANIEVRDLVIDGNRDENPRTLNGCRGAGVFLLAVKNARVSNVVVRDLNGDAIGFQQCTGVTIEDCLMEKNTGHGLHPGSGSVGGVMRRCRCIGNGHDGVFFCLRATYCVCDACEFIGNGDHGVSIGHRDTNNAIVGCRVAGNYGAGIFFREADEVMAPHVTLIADNTVADNCTEKEDAEILIAAPVRGVRIINNVIEHHAGGRPVFGIHACAEVGEVVICGNRFAGDFAQEMKLECEASAVVRAAPEGALAAGPDAAPPDADRHLPRNVRRVNGDSPH
jgi:hypothetical protein